MPKATGGTSRDFFNQLARLRKPPAPPEACTQEQSRKNASILAAPAAQRARAVLAQPCHHAERAQWHPSHQSSARW